MSGPSARSGGAEGAAAGSADVRPPRPRRGLARTAVEAALVALAVSYFGATAVGISGDSMLPTLHSGERAFVPRYETWLHRLGLGAFRPGDVVYFPSPEADGARLLRPLLIKRIVAGPGDSVALRSGTVIVNGVALDEAYLGDGWHGGSSLDETVVPPGHVFVLGDNRGPFGSVDSRTFGPVRVADLAGRVTAVVWPLWRGGPDGAVFNPRRLRRPDAF